MHNYEMSFLKEGVAQVWTVQAPTSESAVYRTMREWGEIACVTMRRLPNGQPVGVTLPDCDYRVTYRLYGAEERTNIFVGSSVQNVLQQLHDRFDHVVVLSVKNIGRHIGETTKNV